MEEVPASVLDQVLVRADTCRLQALAGDLLDLVTDHVHRSREILAWDLLLARVEDPDLRVGNAAHEARLGPRLAMGVAVAAGRPATHGCDGRLPGGRECDGQPL